MTTVITGSSAEDEVKGEYPISDKPDSLWAFIKSKSQLGRLKQVGFSGGLNLETGTVSKFMAHLMNTDRFVPGSHPTWRLELGTKDSLLVKPGASVILGKAGSGKSLLTKTVLHDLNDEIIDRFTFVEPEDDSFLAEGDLYVAIMESTKPIIICDSLRTFFFSSSGGATGKGGVNMSLFSVLTYWDVLGRATGRHFMFTLNPLSTDDDAIDLYIEAAKGAVSMAIHTNNIGSIGVTGRYLGDRDMVQMSYTTAAIQGNRRLKTSDQDQSVSDLSQSRESALSHLYTTRKGI